MTDNSSVTTLVVGDRLPWPDDRWFIERKGPFDASAIYHSGVRRDCEIRKISALGVTVASDGAGARRQGRGRTGNRAACGGEDRLERSRRAWRPLRGPGRRHRAAQSEAGQPDAGAADDAAAGSALPRPYQMRREFLAGDAAQYLEPAACSWRASEVPPVGTFVSIFVEGLNIPCGRSGVEPRRAGRHRAAGGAELDLDHPVGAKHRAQGSRIGQPALTKLSSTRLRPACSKSISSLLPSIAAIVP